MSEGLGGWYHHSTPLAIMTLHVAPFFRVYPALLSLLSSAQQQDSGTELVLATLGCLARLVAGDTAYEERVFDKR